MPRLSRDPPIASISSMKPIAPPSLRAAFRRALKKERIRDAVPPNHIDCVADADMNRNGTPACLAIAFARYVLPVPGWSLEEDAAPRRAAELLAERRVAQEHVERAQDLIDLRVETADLGEPHLDLLRVDHQMRRAAREHRHR